MMAHKTMFRTALAAGLILLLGACSGAASDDTATAGSEGDAVATEAGASGECSSTAVADLIAEVDGLDADEREALLLEQALAARDGQVSLYSELNSEDTGLITEMFEEAYDGLTLGVYRAGSDQVRQRILEESEGGFQGVDLIEIEALEMVILEERGLLAPAASPFAADVVEAGQFENFTADRVSYIVPVWNTNEVAEDEIPQDFADLADERFAGSMALEDSDVFWFAVLVNHFVAEEGITEEEAVDRFRAIAANADITSGHTTTLELVLAGQYSINANAYTHRTQQFIDEGAPVAYQPVNVPVVAELSAVSVACHASNPAGAMLLADLFLDPEGLQQYYLETNRTPANAELQAEAFGADGEIEPLDADVQDIVADYDRWTTLWDEVVRGQ